MSTIRSFFIAAALLTYSMTAPTSKAWSQEVPAGEPARVFELPPVVVESPVKHIELRPVVDRKIYSGKKTTLIQKSEQPTAPGNQYRQTLAQIPGLMISEVNNESFASIGYRGIGDPHESFNILMLRDGLPVTPDPFGYPAAYYVPPQEALERVEFFRGGAGLLYGPQPGGALDWQLRKAPRTNQDLKLMTKNLGGIRGMYSSFTEASFASDSFGGLGSLAFRGSRGFRESNSDSKILNPRLNFGWNLDTTSRLSVDVDHYQGKFGEPGGLALTRATGVIALDEGIEKTTLANDRFEFDRTGAVLTWDKDWSAQTGAKTSLWYSQAKRASFRQALGTAPAFGGIANGTTNTVQEQNFQTTGIDVRFLYKYELADNDQNLSLALTVINTNSPYSQQTGASAFARSGTATKELARKTLSSAVAVENAFKIDRLTVTPGVRAESIEQNIEESLNVGATAPLRNAKKTSSPLLGGLGAEYRFEWGGNLYTNFSQGYKPPSFTDTVPLSTGDVISEEIKEAKTFSKEVGLRGAFSRIETDISVFQIDFSDQFGRVGTSLRNVGSSRTDGLEVLVAGKIASRLSAYANATFLSAKFTGGPLEGKTPQYAPKEMFRAGITWAYDEKSNVRLQMQSTGEHFGDDANTDRFKLPSTTVWDLSGEQELPGLWKFSETRINWGIQNLFDLKSHTRVRSNGAEPLQPLSVYAGLTLYL